jgi:2-aminoadipate transaminase
MMRLKSDGGSSPLLQRIIVEFCKAGGLEEHTRKAQRTYQSHRDRMVEALRRDIPDAAIDVPLGGYYLWLTLPREVDGDELARRGRDEGVIALAGSQFFADEAGGYPRNGAIPKNHMRLAFSHAAPDEIDDGVRRLARAYRSMRAR